MQACMHAECNACTHAEYMYACGVQASISITIIETEAHESIVGLEQGHKDSKVGWASRKGLYIYMPFIWIQPKCLLGALDAKRFHLIYKLHAPIVTSANETFGVLVRQAAAETFLHRCAHEVLRP